MYNHQSKGKRIAKNTMLMYIRMFISMAISLFTSRVVLHALGVTDFGIYNVVGGTVTFFAFINVAMMASTQRFLNFEMGRGDENELSVVFKTSYTIHIFLALIIILLGCTVGKYLLDYKIKIPYDRSSAATVVLYASCVTCALQILSLPFSSAVIAHEKINIYAWISILESMLKLGTAYLIDCSTADRLKEYATLIAFIQGIEFVLYAIYCRKNFAEVRGRIIFSWTKLKEMGNFAIWCIIGCIAGTFANQGLSVLLGMFFMPAVNAARGIAVQVQGAVTTFGTNLNTAMAPQITQSYASGDFPFFYNIIYRGSKYVFILMVVIAMPILLRTEFIVNLWLGEVPAYTVVFIRLLLCATIIETISYPLMRASDASGKIKIYHSVVGGILLLILPLAYVALRIHKNPIVVFQIYLLVDILAWCARLVILRHTVGLSIRKYVKEVMVRIIVIFAISLALSLAATFYIPQSIPGLILTILFSISLTISISYIIGFDANEKVFIKTKFELLKNKL